LSFIQKSKNIKIFSIGTIKIIIIILASVYLVGSFVPYYEGRDAFLYGSGGIDIIQGSYEYTNEILQKTDFDYIFAAGPYVKTIHNTLIPGGSFGILPLAAFSYLLGGYYGLFYLGPITTILFLIISERVITKLFGSFAGLAALIFLSTDKTLLNVGSQLLTDSVFSLLLILGCFFLIKFLKEKTNTSILLCSSLLTAATFFRYNGVIFLLIEILLISGYFLFQYIKNRKKYVEISDSSNLDLNLSKLFSKIKIKKILKISLYILGPWSIFFIFLFSFNIYFFGEPFTTYLEQRQEAETGNIILSSLTFDSERFESIKSYSFLFAPDRTYLLVRIISLGEVLLTQYSLSIISFTYLFSALLISLYFKINRTEIIIFIVFILSLLSFYSSNSLVSLTGITGRYMIPALPLFFGIIGYLMYIGWKINYQRISTKYFQIFSKSWKGFLIIIFALFFLSTLYYSKPIDSLLIEQNFEFKNPQNFADRYPLDQEGLTEKSVLLSMAGKYAVQYDVIPFNPFGGYSATKDSWASERSKQLTINFLKEMLDDGNELYVFKYKIRGDHSYYKYLEAEHGLILKEHSKTFCKLLRIEDASRANYTQIQSDDICHSFLDT